MLALPFHGPQVPGPLSPSTEVHRQKSNHLLSSKFILQKVKESKYQQEKATTIKQSNVTYQAQFHGRPHPGHSQPPQ